MSPSAVVVLGSANLDLFAAVPAIPAPGETVLSAGRRTHPGGKGLNQAVAAARAGAHTTFLGAVGDDEAGDTLLDTAAAADIDVEHVRRVQGPSGTAWILVRPDGENAIVVDSAANGALTALTAEERAAVASARVLVMQLETPVAAVAEAAREAHVNGVTVVLNAAPVRALPEALLADLDVLVVNQHEAAQLSRRETPNEASAELLGRGPRAVVVTLGADGALLADHTGLRAVPGVPADVVDTTGAGDTFTGVLAATLAEGRSLDDAAARAAAAGALAVETEGAVPSIPAADRIDRRQQEAAAHR